MSNKVMGLRRSVLKAKSHSKNTGWRGGWQDRLDIPKAESTPVLLTRGAYPMVGKEKEEATSDENPEPMAHFHTCLSHGVKLKPRGPGSYYQTRCGIDAGDEDCLPCYARDYFNDRRVGGRYLFSFNVLHVALHERVQKKDKDGKVIKYTSDSDNHKLGDPVLVWEQVTRPRDLRDIREDLDELLEVGDDLEEGGVCLVRKKYIEVGRGLRDQLVDIDAQAEKLCRCGGNLTPVAFTCEGCDEVIIDVEKENLNAEEVSTYSKERQRCPHCGHVGIPVPEPECDECDDPEPLSFCDVIAFIRKKGENTGSHIVVEKVVRLDEFELEDGSSLLEWEEDKNGEEFPALDEDGNWAFTEDHGIQKMALAAWNFEKVHAPRDHEYHASRLGIEVPSDFAPSTHSMSSGGGRPSSKYRNYGKNSSRSRIGEEEEEKEKKEEPEEKPAARRRRGARGRRGSRR